MNSVEKREQELNAQILGGQSKREFSISGDTSKIESEKLMEIHIDKITETFEYQARKFFDPVVIEKLAESMKTNGFTQNIIVVENGVDTYKIVAGDTRYRAAIMAKIPTIRALVFPMTTSVQKLISMSIGENGNRSNISAYEIFLLCRKVLNEKKARTYREISIWFGGVYSVDLIKRVMAYGSVHEEITNDAENGIFFHINMIVAIRAATRRLSLLHPEMSSEEIYQSYIRDIYQDVKLKEIDVPTSIKIFKKLGVKNQEEGRVICNKDEIRIDMRYLSREDKEEILEEIAKLFKKR